VNIYLDLGKEEKTELVISRNWFTGSFYYLENGNKKSLRSSLNPTTHFNVNLKKEYEFVVGQREKFSVKIEHIRPLLFAGFRPHKYIVYVNCKIFKEYKGY